MSDVVTNVDRLLDLAEAVCDGTASPGDYAELDSIVLADEVSRSYYWDYCRMHFAMELESRACGALRGVSQRGDLDSAALLPWEADALKPTAMPFVSASPAPTWGFLGGIGNTIHGVVSLLPEGMPFACMVAAVVLGLGIFIASIIPVSYPESAARLPTVAGGKTVAPSKGLQPELQPEPKIVSVARITGMVDCQWVDTDYAPIHDRVVQGDKFMLKSGLMEITYKTGAKVILQGPCTYEVESTAGGYLSLGKLTARVESRSRLPDGTLSSDLDVSKSRPAGGTYFAVRTPTAVVTDLGTEFGVEVAAQGVCHVETYAGLVTVTRTIKSNPSGEPQRVAAGQAVQVSPDGKTITRLTSQRRNDFVTVSRLPQIAQESRAANSYERWRQYSLNLRKDPDLVAYYTFDNKSEAPGRLLNRAKATVGRHDGTLGDGNSSTMPAWAVGRWPGKVALAFDAAKETRVVVPHDDALNLTKSMTIAVWLKPDDPSRVMHLVNKAVAPQTTFNMVWIGKYPDPTFERSLYFDWGWGGMKAHDVLPVESRWIHLAVSCDATREVVYYIDGAIAGSCPSGTTLATNGDVVIGYAPWEKDNAFIGLMDELAIFRRVLSAGEIYRMATIGKPSP